MAETTRTTETNRAAIGGAGAAGACDRRMQSIDEAMDNLRGCATLLNMMVIACADSIFPYESQALDVICGQMLAALECLEGARGRTISGAAVMGSRRR